MNSNKCKSLWLQMLVIMIMRGDYDGYYYSYHDQPKLPRARELIIIDFHYYIINSKDNFVHSSNEFDS